MRDALARRVRNVLATQSDVREVNMFGGVSFMVHERMVAAAGRDGSLLVRINPANYDELLRRGGEPALMGNDRPMGEGWLIAPPSRIQDDADLAYWVEVSLHPNVHDS